MKTAEKDILEVEDPVKKARAQKAFEALNHIFSGKEKGLIDSVLNDYAPVTKIVDGQEVTKAPGLSFGSFFNKVLQISTPKVLFWTKELLASAL